ncbi:MAG TPA: CocE/NonD family hydrolase [Candidatus Limnocylindrales bacterium]
MTTTAQPRYGHEVRRDVRIPVRDGLELSANLWLPVVAGASATGAGASDPEVRARFPVVLEMIPYGKDNWRHNWDTAFGEWLAARGFALCRLDVRGTGSSPGVAIDEYAEAETLDGYDAVEWLAAQPWCTGSVGMWGISYGGFTAIQVAKLRPPHLRAILPMYATDDRYRDDVHIRGGCITASEKSQYAVSQLGMNAMPPRPSFRGEGWRDEWHERLEATPPWLMSWVREQTDGPYWRRGSLAPDYDAIACAIFQVAGWNDSYVDAAMRIQERCVNAPRRTIIGNWVHSFPDDAYPRPHIDWLRELVRFFDRYLNDVDNGWDAEPALTWFERTWATPERFPEAWPGRWRAADTVAVPGTAPLILHLGPGSLDEGHGADGFDAVVHRATVGTAGGLSWGAGWAPNGLAGDLRPDEALGITYTTAPLVAPLSVAGFPEAVLHVSATMPVATCVVRLSEVSPDGVSSLVATGVLNLTHRRSHTDPEPMPVDPRMAPEEVRIPLRATGYRFTPGHRIRLSVLTSYWPALWPSPLAGELLVHRGPATPSRLVLPVLPDETPAPTPPALAPPGDGVREIGIDESDEPEWRTEADPAAGTVTVTIADGAGTTAEDGSRLYAAERLVLVASDPEPANASLSSDVVYRWAVDGHEVDIRAQGGITSDVDAFDVAVALDVRLDGEPFFARDWHERIPRRLV